MLVQHHNEKWDLNLTFPVISSAHQDSIVPRSLIRNMRMKAYFQVCIKDHPNSLGQFLPTLSLDPTLTLVRKQQDVSTHVWSLSQCLSYNQQSTGPIITATQSVWISLMLGYNDIWEAASVSSSLTPGQLLPFHSPTLQHSLSLSPSALSVNVLPVFCVFALPIDCLESRCLFQIDRIWAHSSNMTDFYLPAGTLWEHR